MKKIFVLAILGCLLITGCAKEESANVDKWGIELSVKDITNTGLTLICKQAGGECDGELQTGAPFSLDEYIAGEWKPVETEPIDFAWNALAYMIKENDITEWNINWEWIYGELPLGEYRINKEFANYRAPGDYDTKIYSTEFEVK